MIEHKYDTVKFGCRLEKQTLQLFVHVFKYTYIKKKGDHCFFECKGKTKNRELKYVLGRMLPSLLLFFRKIFPKTNRHILTVKFKIPAFFDGYRLKILFPELLEKLFIF